MATPEALDVADSVPQRLLLLVQPAPESVQITPLPCESFCTIAVKGCAMPVCTLTVSGDTATTIAGAAAARVMLAAADFVLSATELAVSVTIAGVGTLAGAV
jgi:hypothetical protein